MDKAFGWIGEIFQTLLRLLPWLVIVPATHSGVAFVHGHRIKKWGPGLHWYWPVATSYKLMMIVRQTQKIQGKVVMTKDNKTVIVGAMVGSSGTYRFECPCCERSVHHTAELEIIELLIGRGAEVLEAGVDGARFRGHGWESTLVSSGVTGYVCARRPAQFSS